MFQSGDVSLSIAWYTMQYHLWLIFLDLVSTMHKLWCAVWYTWTTGPLKDQFVMRWNTKFFCDIYYASHKKLNDLIVMCDAECANISARMVVCNNQTNTSGLFIPLPIWSVLLSYKLTKQTRCNTLPLWFGLAASSVLFPNHFSFALNFMHLWEGVGNVKCICLSKWCEWIYCCMVDSSANCIQGYSLLSMCHSSRIP